MPNKTLIILSPGFPENEDDSTCIPPQQVFVKALKKVNPQLNIIVLAFTYPFFSKEYYWNDIRVISFGNQINNKLPHLLTRYKVWSTLKKLNKELEVIGLLSFWLGKCALIGNKFAKKYQLKHYCWLLGQDVKLGNKYFYKTDPDASSLIAISDFTARNLSDNYHIYPQHIIPVGVDIDLFDADDVIKDIDILGSGSLIPLKQYDVFLEVVQTIKQFKPNVKAVICGDGPQLKKLKEMIGRMDLSDNVFITGRIAHTEVLKFMQRAKIFLHPSNFEGFSTVCLEALYACAKVISFVQPMEFSIDNWSIAANKEEMVKLIEGILQDTEIIYKPTLPYLVHDNAKAIISLFE